MPLMKKKKKKPNRGELTLQGSAAPALTGEVIFSAEMFCLHSAAQAGDVKIPPQTHVGSFLWNSLGIVREFSVGGGK